MQQERSAYRSIDRGSKMFYRYQLAYADDSLVEEESWRRAFRKWFLGGIRGYIIASLEVILSLVWIALYIKSTYVVGKMPAWIQGLNWTFVICFVVIFAIHITASENRLRFLLSGFAIIDYLTIIPYFFSTFAGAEFLRLTGILRVFRLLRALALAPTETSKKLLQISLIIVCFLFVSSSLLLVVEPSVYYNWWLAFYFVVVAIFTVGFGDYTPQTFFGQALVILIILTGVILIPMQAFALGKIITAKQDPRKLKYKIASESKHLVVFGNSFSVGFLTEMINEFAIKYRIQRHVDLHVVVMQTTLPSSDLQELCTPPTDGQVFVHILYGSALNFEDLDRAGVKNAECAITIFDNDHDSCLAHMSLKSFNRRIAIFSLLQRPEKMALYRTVNTFKENHGEVIPTILCRLEIGAALLSRSVTTRGFATLVSNLVRTRTHTASATEENHSEYRRGAAYEIYFGVLPLACSGQSFSDFSLYVYARHDALLIGLMTDGKHPLLNPGSKYIIRGGELGIFLAPDASVTVIIKDISYLPLLRDSHDGIVGPSSGERGSFDVVELDDMHSSSLAPSTATIENMSRINLNNPTGMESLPSESQGLQEIHMDDTTLSNQPISTSSTPTPPLPSSFHQQSSVRINSTTQGSASAFSSSKKPSIASHSGVKYSSPLASRNQMKWDIESQNEGRIIRYHEALRHPESFGFFYRVLDSPRTLRSAMITSPPEDGHIILYGSTIDWLYYIAPLRSRSVSQCQPIVIVTPGPLTKQQWASIAHFPAVYVSPYTSLIHRSEIERLNVAGSTHIVIAHNSKLSSFANFGNNSIGVSGSNGINITSSSLNQHSSLNSAKSSTSSSHLDEEESLFGGDDDSDGSNSIASDLGTRDSLIAFSWLKMHCPKTRIIMDIKDEYDLRFLHKSEHSKQPFLQQEVRNGSACSSDSTISRLLAQTVYNPFVFDVVMQLIFGTRVADEEDQQDSADLGPSNNVLGSSPSNDDDMDSFLFNKQLKPLVRLEQIPSHLKSGTYRDLFQDLIKERDILPLGLYRQRPRAGKSRKDQYVFTCPHIDTSIQPGDRVYVLFPQHVSY